MINPKSQGQPNAMAPQFCNVGDGADRRRIAFRKRVATDVGIGRPGVTWFGGLMSNMLSTKASAIDNWASEHGCAFLRFDYSGHGESDGQFEDGTISRWTQECLALIRVETAGPQIIVGSSMGGWIAFLVAKALALADATHRLAGFVLIAPALDFTERLMWAHFSPAIRREIETTGMWMRPSEYASDPYPITRALIEDGRKHLLFGSLVRSHCPVHILQGMLDPDVPWSHAMTLVEHLAADPVVITLVKDGDHRLSRQEDIKRLLGAIEAMR